MHPVRLPLSRACATLAFALAGVTASCSFNPSSLSGGDRPDGAVGPMSDANGPRPDADPNAPDGSVTAPDGGMADAMGPPPCQDWPRPAHFDPCMIPAPSAGLLLNENGEYVYDTNTGTLRSPGGMAISHAKQILPGNPEVQLISVERLEISSNARLRAVGSRPLLVASWSDIRVDGRIDVSSRGGSSGAGANTGTCDVAETGGSNSGGGGGGGGGGFNGDGGNGGTGAESVSSGGAKGDRVTEPTTVRGGCKGGDGGTGFGDAVGRGGAGGGALQLTARDLITINGRLHAGGAGGGGATGTSQRRCGGGGGGSGGLIGLEAPTLSIGQSTIIAANGGGGGEGAEDADGEPGIDGQLGAGAAGGGSDGDSDGGDGGAGGAQADRDARDGETGTRSGSQRGGGGGGGGGAGYIILDGTPTVNQGAVLSPTPVMR